MNIKITQLQRSLPEGVVTLAHWEATKTSNEFFSSVEGDVFLNPPQNDDIVPFEELTEEQVLQWVSSKIDLISIEEYLDAQLDTMINPPIATGLPWGLNSAQE